MTVQFSNNLSFYGRGNQGIDAHVSLGSVDMSFVAQKESEMSTGPSLCGGENKVLFLILLYHLFTNNITTKTR